jgi:GTPase Era involved in 16S rRNA processing
MNYTEIKQLLRDVGENVCVIVRGTANESALADLASWKMDIDTDVFSIVVVGEFNRGKSTLLNALFGMTALPVGITPTTAVVTILRFAEKKQIQVRYRNGQSEDIEYSETALMRFIAESPSTADAIDYVEIGIPHELLRSGVVYVDTPGVSDLSRERTEITYRFVPRADAVLFVIDSTHPVTRSEMDFLETAILDRGVERLLFVSNFSDLLDDEEKEKAEEKTGNKLAAVIGATDPKVFLLSAVRGLSENTRALSGIDRLLGELQTVTNTGPRSQEKALRMRDRLAAIIGSVKGDIEQKRAASQLTAEEFLRESAALEEQWQDREAKVVRIGEWVRDREAEIFAMTEKSLDTFFRGLYEDVHDHVTMYSGPDFKKFIEIDVPIVVKKRCKGWVEGHGDALRSLVMRLSSELTGALSREFEINLPLLEPKFVTTGINPETFQISSPEMKDGRMQAGLILGGVYALLSFTGLGLVAPLLSFAALPSLSGYLAKGSLEDAKLKLKPELDRAFYSTANSMRNNIIGYLDAEINGLQDAAESKYRQLLNAARNSQRMRAPHEPKAHPLSEARSRSSKKQLPRWKYSNLGCHQSFLNISREFQYERQLY